MVKQTVHVKTGKSYACKIIDKELMKGKEELVGVEFLTSEWACPALTLLDRFEMKSLCSGASRTRIRAS